ncbi:MAG: sulfatase-like hydrolase/transferase [Planctomycetes bacterium]|nr:sulfatase-like hydrolase/transferase [Planctomycetota bacterium]
MGRFFHRSLLLGILIGSGCHPQERPPAPNILLITIDTLRYDRLGCTGSVDAHTPHLDRLAEKGVVFDGCIVSVPITLPSHCTIMTGLRPFESAVRRNEPYALGDEAVTLAEILKQEGYATRAVVSGEPLAPGCGLEQGFDLYRFKPGSRRSQASLLETPADETTSITLKEANALTPNQPYFLWVHYYDPHEPYTPPQALIGTTGTPLDRAYNGEVTFVDQEIGRLLKGLEKRGLLDSTYIIVTGDHGEGLGDHGEATHAFFLYDTTVRVPLIMRGPGILENRICRTQVRSQDLKDTILLLAGVGSTQDMPVNRQAAQSLADYLQGRSSDPAAPPAFSESIYCHDSFRWAQLTSWRETDRKLIRGSREEFYNLENDPNELYPLPAGTKTEELERYSQALDLMLKNAKHGIDRGPLIEIDLPGYFGSSGPGTDLFLKQDVNSALPHPTGMSVLLDDLLMGIAQVDGGHLNRARTLLEKIVQEDPGNPTAWFWLGRAVRSLAEKEGNLAMLEEARTCFEKVLCIDPEHTKAFHMSTWCLIQSGDFQNARESLEAWEKTKPPSSKHWELLGFLYATKASAGKNNPLFDLTHAFDAFDQSLTLNQNQPGLLEKLIGLSKGFKRPDLEKRYQTALEKLYRTGWQ